MSCANCHEQGRAFTDGKARRVGVTGEPPPRCHGPRQRRLQAGADVGQPNGPPLENQALVPMFGEDPVEMGWPAASRTVRPARSGTRYRALFRRRSRRRADHSDDDHASDGRVPAALFSLGRPMRAPHGRCPMRLSAREARRRAVLLRAARMLPLPWRVQLHRQRGARAAGVRRSRVPQHRALQPSTAGRIPARNPVSRESPEIPRTWAGSARHRCATSR